MSVVRREHSGGDSCSSAEMQTVIEFNRYALYCDPTQGVRKSAAFFCKKGMGNRRVVGKLGNSKELHLCDMYVDSSRYVDS